MKTTIQSVQVPRGSATRWAWRTTRLIAVIVDLPHQPIVAATDRLLSWRSGNYSSRAQRAADAFVREWDGREIDPLTAYRLVGPGRRGCRALREAARMAVYNRD